MIFGMWHSWFCRHCWRSASRARRVREKRRCQAASIFTVSIFCLAWRYSIIASGETLVVNLASAEWVRVAPQANLMNIMTMGDKRRRSDVGIVWRKQLNSGD